MGAALAGILEQTDEQGRPDEVSPLLDAATVELPAEPEVRRLLEAASVEDVDAAITAARADGDVFEGDELATGEEVQITGARLVEAKGAGAHSGTKRFEVVVARPGRAGGTGRRYYAPRMLESNATNFGGQPMFYNHEDLDVILKRGHGSRDPRDLCGWLQEATWWDPDYTEPDDSKSGRLKGAVKGHADLDDAAAELCVKFPQAVAGSINMDSTKITVGRTDTGQLAPLVEGVVKGSGSFDLITGAAGAGGKVLERLREAAESRYRSGHADLDLAEVADDRLVEAVRSRPELLAQLRDAEPIPTPEDPVSGTADTPGNGNADTGRLVEAVLADPAAQSKLVEALASSDAFSTVIDARVSQREDSIREDATAESNRALDLRDMRDEARRLVEANELLPHFPAFASSVLERYELRDGHPSPALDVFPEYAEDGSTVTKPAIDRLRESVQADIDREVAKLREAAPARVGGLGGALVEAANNGGGGDGGDGNGDEPEPPKDAQAERLGLDPARVRELQGA